MLAAGPEEQPSGGRTNAGIHEIAFFIWVCSLKKAVKAEFVASLYKFTISFGKMHARREGRRGNDVTAMLRSDVANEVRNDVMFAHVPSGKHH